MMKTFLKYAGAILVLLGVGILAYYYFVAQSNALLLSALCVMVIGLVAHIIINRHLGK